jgi:hypothetical protein
MTFHANQQSLCIPLETTMQLRDLSHTSGFKYRLSQAAGCSVAGEQRLARDFGERLWCLVVTESLAEDGGRVEAPLSNGSEYLGQQWCDARPPSGERDCVHVHRS